MEWTDENTTHTGASSAASAFPHGSIRWRNLGSSRGLAFDLLVKVSELPASYYSEYVVVEYRSPKHNSQAEHTSSGFACIGIGLRTSYCMSGAIVDSTTAECIDGTPTTMHGAEFDFTFVQASTTIPFLPISAVGG
jgi:uncharacterized protein YcbK (DUF882 family)